MVSTLAPSARQNAASFSTAAASAPSGGVRMHQRPTNRLGKARVRPEFSVPATGCAGTKCTPAGKCGAISRNTAPFTEPTSETIAPGERCGPISAATAPHAPTGMQTMTRSAPATAAALLSTTWSASPSSATRRRVSAVRARRHDLAHRALRARRARDRRADQADADQGQAVEQGLRALWSRRHAGLAKKFFERARPPAGSPPRCRRSCAAHSAACRP